jgi:hypothetical protein
LMSIGADARELALGGESLMRTPSARK